MDQYDSLKASLYDGYFTGVEGDVPFYVEQALRAHSTVLELGCGTGRITIPIAQAGVRVIGIDTSSEMLTLARASLRSLNTTVQRRIQLLPGDMRDFSVNRQFKLIIIPYRTFMHLLTPQEQVQALLTIREHLATNGRLIFNIFDPGQQLLEKGADTALLFDTEFTHPASGRRFMAWYNRRIDITRQLIEQHMLFDELDNGGTVVARHYSPLTLRYSHRYEMHYLLELCGYEIEDLYGDFSLGPYRGGEQIWVAKRVRA